MQKLYFLSQMLIVTSIFVLSVTSTASHADKVIPVANSTANSIVHLTPAQSADFQTGMQSLSDQAHVAIVIEGTPLHPHLSDNSMIDLSAGAPVGSAISTLAAAYDYNTKQENGVFILNKKYTDPKDLPCVTLGECKAASQNIMDIINAFLPRFPESSDTDEPHALRDATVELFDSFSPAENKAAISKTLLYGELSPSQQNIINNFILDGSFQGIDSQIGVVSKNLVQADEADITFTDPQHYSGLFMVFPSSLNPGTFYDVTLVGVPTPPGQQNPVLMFPQRSVISTEKSASVKQQALSEIVNALSPIEDQKPTVEADIKNLPVTAFGLKDASSKDVFQALADLYGLKNGVSQQELPQLQLPYVQPPATPRDVASAAWEALPASLDHALHMDSKGNQNIIMLPLSLQQAAGKAFLLAIQPQIKRYGLTGNIPVSSLDQPARNELAIMLMTDILITMQNNFNEQIHKRVYDCLENMNQIIIYTIPSQDATIDGQIVPSYYLVGTDPYTHEQVGLGGAQFFSHN